MFRSKNRLPTGAVQVFLFLQRSRDTQRHPHVLYDDTKVLGAGAATSPARLNRNGFWSPPKSAKRKPRAPTEYNLSLSEMRQYSDNTMVLVLSQDEFPAPEADYPIHQDADTSTLLDDAGAPNHA